MRDFDADRASVDQTPIPFKIQGAVFHALPFDGGLLMAISDFTVAEEDRAALPQISEDTKGDVSMENLEAQEVSMEWVRSLAGLAKAVEEMIVPGERRRWRKIRRRLTGDDLGQLAMYLVQEVTNRPTSPPSSTEPSRAVNGAGSTTDSSPPTPTP